MFAFLFFVMHHSETYEVLYTLWAPYSIAAEIERNRNFFTRFLALIVPGIPEQLARVVALNTKVEGFAQLDYRVTNVFVTFETENDQVSF